MAVSGRYLKIFLGVMLLFISSACGDDPVNPVQNDDSVIWRVSINHKSIVLAQGQTLQLMATPVGKNGITVESDGQITWTSSDVINLPVDSNGLLTAVGSTSGAVVVARLYDLKKNITRYDTAAVIVTPDVQPVSDFGFLGNPTSLNIEASGYNTIQVGAEIGGNVVNVPFKWMIKGVTAVAFTSPTGIMILGMEIGRVDASASSFIYGTEYTDSIIINFTAPSAAQFMIVDRGTMQRLVSTSGALLPSFGVAGDYWFRPLHLTIKRGGRIMWMNYSNMASFGPDAKVFPPVTVNFDRMDGIVPAEPVVAEQVTAGGAPQMRVFNEAGVYRWSSPDSKQTGIITVIP